MLPLRRPLIMSALLVCTEPNKASLPSVWFLFCTPVWHILYTSEIRIPRAQRVRSLWTSHSPQFSNVSMMASSFLLVRFLNSPVMHRCHSSSVTVSTASLKVEKISQSLVLFFWNSLFLFDFILSAWAAWLFNRAYCSIKTCSDQITWMSLLW